ncbi:substrate-binding domain-containing protein [Vibrio sp.]|nr:substrate-binding domain-containing protein [Vibrio sp.]
MATVKDVAKEAGVSVATVSRVINKSPKASKHSIEVVSNAMQKLGYRPNAAARALVNKSSDKIGVVLSDASDPFFGSLVKAVDHIAQQHNKNLIVGNGYHNSESERRAIDMMIDNRCDAIVVHSKGLSDSELIKFAEEVPELVIINRRIPQIIERCVFLDNKLGAFLATTYLLEQGHTHIACFASNQSIEDASQRIAGYQEALEEFGLDKHHEYVIPTDPDAAGGEQAMQKLLQSKHNVTAIVTYNDYVAAGALSVLHEENISVPDSMSLVGFDNGLIARYLNPQLTTIDYPIMEMAKHATLLALAYKEKKPAPTFDFAPRVIPRNSVASLLK